MKLQRNLIQIILRVAGFVLGLISILGGIVAWNHSGEPERYLVLALVMFSGGILWFLSSVIAKFQPDQKQYLLILAALPLGLILSLFYTFAFCGGECNCSWFHGYPGYWLRISKCTGILTNLSAWNVNAWNGDWNIDVLSLMADAVFWIDAGLIGAFMWAFIRSKQFLPKRI